MDIVARVEIDDAHGVAYVSLTPTEDRRGTVAKSLRVESSLVLDFDVAGVLIGVEILDLPGFPITWPASAGRKG